MREAKGTYPLWQINLPLLSNKLKHTSMCNLSTNGAVNKLKEHRVFDVKSSKLLKGRGRQEDLSTINSLRSIWARQHVDGVAAELLIESLGCSSSSHLSHSSGLQHRVYFCWVVALVVTAAELGRLSVWKGHRVKNW